METMSKYFPENVSAWISRESQLVKNREVFELLVDTPKDREWGNEAIKHNRRVAILPKNLLFAMDFAISEEILAITSFDPLFTVVIHSNSIAHSAMTLFDFAWNASEELKI